MAGLINNWLEQAEQQNSAEPAWLQNKRQQAFSQLESLQDPNRKLEFWRYADVGRLTQVIDAGTESRPESALPSGNEEYDLVIRITDSGFELSAQCPDWLVIKNINELDEELWADLSFDQETVVNLANVVLFDTGVCIEISKTAKPVSILIDYQFAESNKWQYLRNQIQLAEGVHAKITERLHSGRLNVVNLFQVANQTELLRMQDFILSSTEQLVSFNQFDLNSEASVTNMSQHLGGALQHHLHRVNFNGQQAKYTSGSINKSYNNNNIVDLIEVNHHHKNNQSEVTHRSIAKDKSQIFNNAKAMVAPGADQSEIEQDLKNILLSEDAKIFSKPELEVYADEVVAAHGSTIGALDEQSLFYLQSRGIAIEQAREIMIESFEQEAIVC